MELEMDNDALHKPWVKLSKIPVHAHPSKTLGIATLQYLLSGLSD